MSGSSGEGNGQVMAQLGVVDGPESQYLEVFRHAAFPAALSRVSDSCFVDVNDAFVETFGWTREEVLGRTAIELGIHPDPNSHADAKATLERKTPLRDHELELRKRNGESVVVLVYASVVPIRGEKYILSSVQDITERKRVERDLALSEQRYRALFTASNDVLYRMTPDWSEMQPLDGRALVLSNQAPIRGWLENNIPAEEHGRVREAIARAIADKSVFHLEHKVYRPDKSIGWTSSRAVPLLDEEGNIVEWFGAAADITERVNAEQSLDRQRLLYEGVLNNTPDLAYIFDLDHRFIYANQGLLRMWGKTWDEAIGKNCLELGYEPWHAEMHDREIEQVKATKAPIRGEVPFTGTFGRRIYDYIFSPVLGAEGEVVAIAGTTRDVTDYREKEEALRESEERLEAAVEDRTHELLDANEQLQGFTYSIAHDLRQQIRGINTNAMMLLQDASDELAPEHQATLNRLVASSKKLSTVVDDLLKHARLGRLDVNKTSFSMSELAKEVGAYLFEQAIFRPSTRFLVADGLEACADPVMLRIVLENLLENAAKYSAVREVPKIEVGREGNEFYVRDNGIGFEMRYAPKLFVAFERLHGDSEYLGTGIGLANVRRIIEKHGGSVRAEAEVGKGATFWFTLPD